MSAPRASESGQRLYGLRGAEVMYFDPAGVYESEIEPWPHTREFPITIEEWSVREPISHVPSAFDILTWIIDTVADDGEYSEVGYDQWETKAQEPDVVAAIEAARTVLASKITFRMADKLLVEHLLTWDDEGEPLYDGEPMYVKQEAPDVG